MLDLPSIIFESTFDRLLGCSRDRGGLDLFLWFGPILLLKHLGVNNITRLDGRGRSALPSVVVQSTTRARKETTGSTVLAVTDYLFTAKADIPCLGFGAGSSKGGVQVAHHPEDITFLKT